MVHAFDRLWQTPSQTAGPYVHIGLTPDVAGITGVYPRDLGSSLCGGAARGEHITVKGHVFDGAGAPLKDALIEIWQADADGIHASPAEPRGSADPHFSGFGRAAADPQSGAYAFETVKPGRVPFGDGRLMAPHITFWIVARGINLGLHTRMYFSDEPVANAEDPVLGRIEQEERINTLIGRRSGDVVVFDIHLQGDRETVFFDI